MKAPIEKDTAENRHLEQEVQNEILWRSWGAMEYTITNDKDPRCEPRVRVAHGFFQRVAVALNLQPDPVAKPDCRNYRFC